MADVQRIFVCLDMHRKLKEKDFKIDAKYLVAVTGCKASSSKITLVMGAHADWR